MENTSNYTTPLCHTNSHAVKEDTFLDRFSSSVHLSGQHTIQFKAMYLNRTSRLAFALQKKSWVQVRTHSEPVHKVRGFAEP